MRSLAVARSQGHDQIRSSGGADKTRRAPRVALRPLAADAHALAELVARRALPRRPLALEHEVDRVAHGPQRALPPTPARCACGGTPGPDGECAACKARRLGLERALLDGDAVAARVEPGVERELDEEGPPVGRQPLPYQGDATIVCDGRGGYRVDPGWAATVTCGIGDCVRRHEQSHIADWQRRFPNGCKNADGTSKADGTAVPTGGSGYADFLRRSECTAYGVEIPCEEALLRDATDACKPTIQTVLADSRRQQRTYCGSR